MTTTNKLRRMARPASYTGASTLVAQASTLRSGPAGERVSLLARMITRIDLSENAIALAVDKVLLRATLAMELPGGPGDQQIILTLPATKVRRGHQLRLVIPGPQTISITEATRDEKLVALVAEARHSRQLLLASPDQTIVAIAARHGRCRTRMGKLAALSCLAPDIVTAIVEGRQPATLTARTLQDIELPLAWSEQRALLGFG